MNRIVVPLLLVMLACSSDSALASSYESSNPEPEIPSRDSATVELTVRPDLIRIPFALESTDPDPRKALETAMDQLTRQLKDSSSGLATVRLRGLTSEEGDALALKVDGVVEAPLAADQDFWARARLVAAIEKVFIDAGKKLRSKLAINHSAPEPTLKDPESKRAELIQQWAKRARGFAEAVEHKQAPLRAVDCTPPTSVTLHPISLEEIGLSLQINCRLDVVR
jgi:hypothetical protein